MLIDHVTNNIGISSLDNVSEKTSIKDEYLSFNDNSNSDLFSVSEDEDYGCEFPLNYYWSEGGDKKSSFLLPIPTFTTDKYKMELQTNNKLEVNVEVNSVLNSDDSTITNDQYLSPPTYSAGVSI